MLSHLDVILIVDDTLRLPKPKLVVCVDPEFGVFFRINTKRWPVPVLLRKADHPFLDHDSFLECNEGLELDDQIVADSLRRHNGPVGALAIGIVPDIVRALESERTIRESDKAKIISGLKAFASLA